jgi:hypothetical protein
MERELRRLRDDVTTLRSAMGLDPQWDRGDIRTHALLAGAALAAAAWPLLPHRLPAVLGCLAFAVPVWDWARRIRPSSDRSAREAAEWRDSMRVLWYVLPLTALGAWSRFVGLDAITIGGLMVFMMGLVLFGPAVSERGLLPLLPWALACMAGGLIMPLQIAPQLVVFSGAIAAGALLAAICIRFELRHAK